MSPGSQSQQLPTCIEGGRGSGGGQLQGLQVRFAARSTTNHPGFSLGWPKLWHHLYFQCAPRLPRSLRAFLLPHQGQELLPPFIKAPHTEQTPDPGPVFSQHSSSALGARFWGYQPQSLCPAWGQDQDGAVFLHPDVPGHIFPVKWQTLGSPALYLCFLSNVVWLPWCLIPVINETGRKEQFSSPSPFCKHYNQRGWPGSFLCHFQQGEEGAAGRGIYLLASKTRL